MSAFHVERTDGACFALHYSVPCGERCVRVLVKSASGARVSLTCGVSSRALVAARTVSVLVSVQT